MLTYPQGGGAGLSELSSGDARDDKRLSGVSVLFGGFDPW